MIHTSSLDAVAAARWNPHFIKPIYDSYSFSQIPPLVQSVLSSKGETRSKADLLGPLLGQYDKVLLLLIDAFGWRFFERYADSYPFLRRFVQDGVVTKLTSQFPSTTAAHLTTLHTGLPVDQSGVYEWIYYEPTLDTMIAPLLFSYAGDQQRNTLETAGVAPTTLYPESTIYHSLANQGVSSFVFQHQNYTPSPYSNVVCDGARLIPYRSLPEALTDIASLLQGESSGKAYYCLYFDLIDTICHLHGPNSSQMDAEVDALMVILERLLYRQITSKSRNTLLLLTADHGQVEIDPATTLYLNLELPEVVSLLKTNRTGQLLAPAGSPRDLFLHVREGERTSALTMLRSKLAGKAEVYAVKDLIEQQFFGSEAPSMHFVQRVGDLVILPYKGESVWWYEAGRFDQQFLGHHGGLTPEELEIPLLAYTM
jgi:hypothetical protein